MTKRRHLNPKSYYHVIMRGNNRQPIFKTERDMFEILRAFGYVYDKYPFTILAYCFMTNHYHILIKPDRETDSLSKIMGLINRRYSHSFAKRYNYVGRLYQKRYLAKEVRSRQGLLAVSRYIHRNPINTKQPLVEQLELYPYSSYPFYFDETQPPPIFLNRDFLKKLLPPNFEKTNEAYCKYCMCPCVRHNSENCLSQGQKLF